MTLFGLLKRNWPTKTFQASSEVRRQVAREAARYAEVQTPYLAAKLRLSRIFVVSREARGTEDEEAGQQALAHAMRELTRTAAEARLNRRSPGG